jgi:predicted nucleotidyltransferase
MDIRNITRDVQSETVIDKPKKELNQKFFNGLKLHNRVRKAMLEIIDYFIKEMPLKYFEEYVVEKNFVGSMAGFQWAEQSDIDLHIIINEEQLAEEHGIDVLELIELTRKVKKLFENRFYLLGYPIELYVQTQSEPFYSNGVYDLEYDTWTKSPEIEEFDEDKVKKAKDLANKYKKYIIPKLKTIEKTLKSYQNNREDSKLLDKLRDDAEFLNSEYKELSKKRNDSIRQEGETAIFNMEFKFLHRMGTLKKMKAVIKDLEEIKFEIE